MRLFKSFFAFDKTPGLLSSKVVPGVPGIYLVIVLIADYLFPIGTITPFFVVVGIMFMAIFFTPSRMIPWSIIFTGVVCSIFLSPKLHMLFTGKQISDQVIIPLLRAATYCIVCLGACYLCIVLKSLRTAHAHYEAMLKNVPWPILTSDENGIIIYANELSAKLFPEFTIKGGGCSYFDLFAPKDGQGRFIANYLNRLEYGNDCSPLALTVRGKPMTGNTYKLDWNGSNALLTILLTSAFETKLSESKENDPRL